MWLTDLDVLDGDKESKITPDFCPEQLGGWMVKRGNRRREGYKGWACVKGLLPVCI